MSEAEEMYLVTIALLIEAGNEPPIPISRLAQELSIQPVSVSQMIRKLEEADLVAYTPYKGAALTQGGEKVAQRILRHRRLWEVFLVEKLKVPPFEASDLACRLEHFIPDDTAERLAHFLGEPVVNPHGRKIPPSSNGKIKSETLLSQLRIGEASQVAQIDANAATIAFLSEEGVQPGTFITVLAVGGNGAFLVGVEERSVYLTAEVAKCIWVKMPESLSLTQEKLIATH